MLKILHDYVFYTALKISMEIPFYVVVFQIVTVNVGNMLIIQQICV